MTIAYVLAAFPSLSETFILREILALERCGHRVLPFALCGRRNACRPEARHLLANVRYAPPPLRLRQHPAPPRTAGPPQRRPVRRRLSRLRNALAGLAFARLASPLRVQHVHAHFAFDPADTARAMAAALRLHFTLSVHARDLYAQPEGELWPRLRTAAAVVACTTHGRDLAADIVARHRVADSEGTPPPRVELVRHGLSPDEFVPRRSRAPHILAVGRLVEKKGFPVLIEACRLLSERRVKFGCTIAGSGPILRSLTRQIARANLTGRVTLAGAATQARLRELFASACLFVQPSVVASDGDRDGLPNTVLEAMAMELPVVVTDACAAPEAVADGVSGFVVPGGRADALAGRIELLLRRPRLRARLGRAGRQRILRDFDSDRVIAPLCRLFEELNP